MNFYFLLFLIINWSIEFTLEISIKNQYVFNDDFLIKILISFKIIYSIVINWSIIMNYWLEFLYKFRIKKIENDFDLINIKGALLLNSFNKRDFLFEPSISFSNFFSNFLINAIFRSIFRYLFRVLFGKKNLNFFLKFDFFELNFKIFIFQFIFDNYLRLFLICYLWCFKFS